MAFITMLKKGLRDTLLSNWFGVPNIKTESDHEWDALISLQGIIGNWTIDLHTPTQD
ncbi:hypothetical protein [Idiomarina abyssalis]|uniref:hypothetical protein n=1 Tax=Idiomarina abyssalis TaxID=86102 RepID=UPI003A904648